MAVIKTRNMNNIILRLIDSAFFIDKYCILKFFFSIIAISVRYFFEVVASGMDGKHYFGSFLSSFHRSSPFPHTINTVKR